MGETSAGGCKGEVLVRAGEINCAGRSVFSGEMRMRWECAMKERREGGRARGAAGTPGCSLIPKPHRVIPP